MIGDRRRIPASLLLAVLVSACAVAGCGKTGGGAEAPVGTLEEATEEGRSLSADGSGDAPVPEPSSGSVDGPASEAEPDYTWGGCRNMPSGTVLDADRLPAGLADSLFYGEPVPEGVFTVMESASWHGTTPRSDLSYLRMLYIGFDGQPRIGEMVVNRALAQDVLAVFHELYEAGYPIEKMRLIDEYGGDDGESMEDNNTSCFNDRKVPGSVSTSKHAYGCAIDVNPLYNPFIHKVNGAWLCEPEGGVAYQDRDADFPYKIDKEDLCYLTFKKHGFSWGGDWSSMKDYQHFYKEVR